MALKLEGLAAVITGAGSGIGRAVAHGLSDEGARVVAVDIDGNRAREAAAEIASKGGNAIAFEADVADPLSVDNLRSFVRDELGSLAILVNNAAIQVNKLIEDTTPEEWERQMAVNIGGAFFARVRSFLTCERRVA